MTYRTERKTAVHENAENNWRDPHERIHVCFHHLQNLFQILVVGNGKGQDETLDRSLPKIKYLEGHKVSTYLILTSNKGVNTLSRSSSKFLTIFLAL